MFSFYFYGVVISFMENISEFNAEMFFFFTKRKLRRRKVAGSCTAANEMLDSLNNVLKLKQ